ncbi:MAG: hypothetical protein HXX13_16820 [Bacteroidetes bacterium]|nr:hypothetical protein [Bacteroidota bacterium]
MVHSHTVIVLGLYFPGIDILRDFKKRGIQCIGMDCYAREPGFSLKRTSTFVCPDPESHQEEWLEFIMQFRGTNGKKPVLLITSDKFVLPVLKYSEKLSEVFLFHHSYENATEKLMSKQGLVLAAQRSGVPVAKTIFYKKGNDFLDEIGELKYPCLIRPSYGKKWWEDPLKTIVHGHKLIRVENASEVEGWLSKILPYDDELMIQEMIPGPDKNLFYLVIYMTKDQRCLGYFCGQKLRITPIHFGSASYMKTVNAAPVLDSALKILKDNKYWGPAGVEFKKDDDTGDFKLVEINTRFGLWDVMGAKLGVDIFYQAYLDLTGMQVQQLTPLDIDYKWLSITRDVRTYIDYHREKSLSTFSWLKSYFGRVYYADIYLTEPKLMYTLYLRKLFRYLTRNRSSK